MGIDERAGKTLFIPSAVHHVLIFYHIREKEKETYTIIHARKLVKFLI